MSAQLQGIQAMLVPKIWEHVEHLLRDSVLYTHGNLDVEDIKQGLLDRDMQLWVVADFNEVQACMVTRLESYPSQRVAAILVVAGSGMDTWLTDEHMKLFDDWARSHGCTYVEGYMRDGWIRKLRGKGWKAAYTVMRKELQ